jgi:hypothetical protein
MPGFDTLGARLARSRRRLERERAAVSSVERSAGEGLGGSEHADVQTQVVISGMQPTMSAQVIVFPRSSGRIKD